MSHMGNGEDRKREHLLNTFQVCCSTPGVRDLVCLIHRWVRTVLRASGRTFDTGFGPLEALLVSMYSCEQVWKLRVRGISWYAGNTSFMPFIACMWTRQCHSQPSQGWSALKLSGVLRLRGWSQWTSLT